MNAIFRNLLALIALAISSQLMAQVTFYEHDNFQGRSFITERPVNDFGRNGFNDRASSVVVVGERWEICEDIRFSGRCVVLRPGRYASLDLMSLNDRVSSTRPVARNAHVNDTRYAPVPMAPQIIFYEHEDFGGQTFTADQPVADFGHSGFNDRASSVVVIGERWEICADNRFSGQCVVLQPGRYASLDVMGLNDRVSSTRPVARNARIDDERHAAPPVPAYDNRQSDNERPHQANVISVHAVVGPPQRRCWVEREQVVQERGNANAQPGYIQDFPRCIKVPPHARPEFWDVTYEFRGQQHRAQMTMPPGPTITVNQAGEAR